MTSVATEQQQQQLPTTVAGTLRRGIQLYEELLDSSALSPDFQKRVGLAMTLFLRLWSHIQNEGVFRRNETLRETTDTTLELIPVPYYLGVLCEKRVLIGNNNNNNNNNPSSNGGAGAGAGAGTGGDDDPRQQKSQAQQQQQQDDEVAKRVARSNTRMHSLVACNDFLFKFLKVAVDLGLATERDVATKPFMASLDRAARLDLTKKRHALESEVRELSTKVQFARERAKRNARIMKADEASWLERKRKRQDGGKDDTIGDGEVLAGNEKKSSNNDDDDEERALQVSEEFVEGLLEDDDDYQSNKRMRHIRFAEWAILETYAILQGNSRELEMLGSLSDSEKRKAIEDFQRELTAPPGGGFSSSASSAAFNAAVKMNPGGAMTMDGKVDEQGSNYTILPGGRVVPMGSSTAAPMDARQRVREEAFMNRNQPTQTLAEFAELEMEFMRNAQAQEKRVKDDKEAEDARIGEAGVEERERQREAAWDDWKDANPSVGITSKGNYS